MPRGYYLGQGLIPLDEHSSDDDEGPCELPDGRIVCGPHGLTVCGKCCMDFSFMDELRDEDNYDDGDNDDEHSLEVNANQDMFDPFHSTRREYGGVFPTEFTEIGPPLELFHAESRRVGLGVTRYVHRHDPGKVLIMTDGACANNGAPNPKTGWAFVAGPGQVISARLETQGPFGDPGIQSSNRAELRAVIAALGFRVWAGEGFRHVVIATDSDYVVKGSTQWARAWISNGWKTSSGADVKNKDLWEKLLCEVERHNDDDGLLIQMWHIPREYNTVADSRAKAATEVDEAPTRWTPVLGVAA
ncbi:unnamed protein product [Clonostachys chloroleuca]|uniref:ribonuclease H n=1 Tax=Clonostachys chloroleuca TaxID=1926264 RepID=A0AA35LUD8_9HYPO|nr:unnamed protein product [Clonostachys chloroleuca]